MDTTPDTPQRQAALSSVVTHPQQLAFMVRLHRDSSAAEHRLCGRVQHLDSGRRGEFASLAELQAWIEHQLATDGLSDTDTDTH